jgi:tRNA threonylcarbamoyl adenosine modification protein YeaZ
MSRVVLSIDTSTSVSVAVSAGPRWTYGGSDDPRGHTESVAPLMRDLLAKAGVAAADVTDVVVGNGPGPFTGLRVGIVSGLVFGHALGIPVHGICSLDALAQQAVEEVGEGEFLVATDARRKEVYWATYRVDLTRPEQDRAVRLTDPAVARPADVPEEVRSLPTAGRGPLLYPDLFPRPVVGVVDVSAGLLAGIAMERLDAGMELPVEPLYLRRPDALTTAERAKS